MLNIKWDGLLPTEFAAKYNNFIEELQKLSIIIIVIYLSTSTTLQG